MKISLESTEGFVEVDGVTARVWKGTTERGVQIEAYIVAIGVPKDADQSEFASFLQELEVQGAEPCDD